MSADMSRVLLVTHEATRTGAPRVALEVARAFSDREVVTVARAGGPLVAEFAAASSRFRREPLPRLRVLLRRARLGGLANRAEEAVALRVLRQTRPDLAVLNTVVAACYVRPALRLGIPTVLYVHELGPEVRSAVRRYQLAGCLGEIRVAACSAAVRDLVVDAAGLDPGQVEVLTSPVDVDAVTRRAATGEQDEDPADGDGVPLVGACGPAEANKGVDRWLEVAAALRALRPDLRTRFVWVGRRRQLDVDALSRRLGVDDIVEFVGEVDNPYPHIARTAVFVLPSRRDAFPLVVLEAMALSRPVVAFDVGGVADQLGDAGVLVADGDVEKMAIAIAQLLDDPVARQALGASGHARARRVHDVGPFRAQLRRIAGLPAPAP